MQKSDGLFPHPPPIFTTYILLVEMRDFMTCCSSTVPFSLLEQTMEQAKSYTYLSQAAKKKFSSINSGFFFSIS
jgi:hypothetical protein